MTEAADLRSLDGRHRGDPRGRRRPARRGGRRDLRPGRSVPAHPPDVPARPPADPRRDRLSPGLADDARLRPAARPRVEDISAATRDRPLRRAGPARPRAESTRSCRRATWSGWRRRPARRGQATRPRPGSRPCWSRAASTRGSTRTRATARVMAGFLARAFGGPLDPDGGGRTCRGDECRAHPRHRERVRGHPGDARRPADARQRRAPGRDTAAAPG